MSENKLWLDRWENKEIGFNQQEVNPFLKQYFSELNLPKFSKVLVPLCGKSIDISWLLEEDYQVIGIELSEQAVIALFEELEIIPVISHVGELILYRSENLQVFVGDIFKVTTEMIGKIDAIYDRAALVALTKELRIEYAKHIVTISNNAVQLLLCFEYDQSLMNRSPYSVDEDEVKRHYDALYKIQVVCKEEIIGGFKGKLTAFDVVWILK